MIGAVFFFLFVAVAVGIIVGVAQHSARTSLAWADAGRQLGLTLDPGGTFRRAKLEGSMGGFPVRIDTYTERSGNNSTVFTRYRVQYPSLGLDLELSRQTAMSRIGSFFGLQDVEVGDPSFDDAFVVKGESSAQLAVYLTPSRRSALLRLLASYGSAKVSDTTVQVVWRGYERRPEVIVSTARRLVSIARVLTDSTTEELDGALTARAAGDLNDAAERLKTTVHPHPDDVEVRLEQAEILHASGAEAEAARVIDELAAKLPADPDVRGWKERIAAAPQTAPSRRPPLAASVEEMAQDLFGASRLSFETDAVFAEKYRGTPVRWTGVVTRHKRYETDYDFPGGAGTKAVVTVATITNDLYGQTAIDAVIQLPPEADGVLARDQEIAFEGTLDRIDPLMRNFFVTGGRLL